MGLWTLQWKGVWGVKKSLFLSISQVPDTLCMPNPSFSQGWEVDIVLCHQFQDWFIPHFHISEMGMNLIVNVYIFSFQILIYLKIWKEMLHLGLPRWLNGKESACQCRRYGFNPWVRKISLEKEMAVHSSFLAWKIPLTEGPGGLQSVGSQRVGHDWAIEHECMLHLATSGFCQI